MWDELLRQNVNKLMLQLHLYMLIVTKINLKKHKSEVAGVTGPSLPPAGLYPGLKRNKLDYTQVYYDLGQSIFRGIKCPRLRRCKPWPDHTLSGQNIQNLCIKLIFTFQFTTMEDELHDRL